jgi:hypothetical protein
MKHQVPFTVLALSLLVFAAASFAGTGTTLTAKVPFAFTVGEKSVPAGNYTIYEPNPGLIRFGGDQGNLIFLITNPGTRAGDDSSAKLVFHRYGDQYFLSEVFDGTGRQEGLRIQVSKLEKEYMTKGSNSTAANRRQTDIVVYAMVR